MKVSVVIPHYNDLASLELCLAALGRQTFPAEETEIVVADNGSPQGEEAVAHVIGGRARLVTVRQRGAGPARNGGAAASRADILAFIDSDCVPHERWLESGIAALSRCDFAGGGIEVLTRGAEGMSATEAFERVFAFDAESYVLKKGFAPSGNLFCPRTVFEAVNGFGTGVSEDVDWSRRAIALNFHSATLPTRWWGIRHAVPGVSFGTNGFASMRKPMPWRAASGMAGSNGCSGPWPCRCRRWPIRARRSGRGALRGSGKGSGRSPFSIACGSGGCSMPWDCWWGGARKARDPLERHFFAIDTLEYRADHTLEIWAKHCSGRSY